MSPRTLRGAARYGWTAVFGLSCMPSADLGSYSDGEVAAGLEVGEPAPTGGGAVPPAGVEVEGVESGSAETPAAEVFEPPTPSAGSNAGMTTGANADPVTPGASSAQDPVEPASENAEADAEPPPQFRFVRLVADSAIQGPFTSIAEFNVLDGSGAAIDRTLWIAEADSEELVFVGGAPAALAIDGATASIWHTAWFEVAPPPAHPHTLEVDMGQLHEVSGFRYLPRQDGSLDGRVRAYRFFVSVDGVEWGEPVATGTLLDSDLEQQVLVPGN